MKKILIALLLPGALLAQTNIYRSLQPGVTSAIGTSTGTLTISGTTATFSVAQPDSVGVGDAIQYDTDGNSTIDAIAFIHGRTSSTVYTVASAAGGAPTSVTGDEDHDIFRAYSAYASVEGGTENAGIDAAVRDFDAANRNIDSNGEIFRLACYRGTDSPLAFLWDSWDTSPTEYLEIFSPSLESEVGVSQKHLWIYQGSSGSPLSMRISSNTNIGAGTMLNVRIRDVQIKPTSSTAAQGAILFTTNRTGADYRISGCLIVGSPSTAIIYGIRMESLTGTGGNGNRNFRAWNNVIKDCTSNDGGADGTAIAQTGNLGYQPNAYIYNNTVVNCDIGYGDFFNANLARLKNNLFQVPNTLNVGGFALHADTDYNLSSDTEAPGANSILSTTLTFSGDGYHLTSADAAIAVGTDLSGDASLPFSADIDGDDRSTWNMGADEYISQAGRKRKKPIWWSEYHEKDFIDWLLALR